MTQEIVHEWNGEKTETVQSMVLRWHVKEVAEDGTASIEQSVRRLKMSIGDRILIDTANAEPEENDSPIAARLRAIMRVRFTAQTTPRGEILQVQFDPEVLDRLRDQLGLDEKTVQSTFAKESLLFPIRAVDVGGTWTSTTRSTLDGVGEIITSTTYQYVGDESVNGVNLSKFKITPAFQLSDESRALVKQEGDSTLWFDYEQGQLIRMVSHQQFEIKKVQGDSPSMQKNSVRTTLQFSEATEK
jgi:hypothetical protein